MSKRHEMARQCAQCWSGLPLVGRATVVPSADLDLCELAAGGAGQGAAAVAPLQLPHRFPVCILVMGVKGFFISSSMSMKTAFETRL